MSFVEKRLYSDNVELKETNDKQDKIIAMFTKRLKLLKVRTYGS